MIGPYTICSMSGTMAWIGAFATLITAGIIKTLLLLIPTTLGFLFMYILIR